MRWQVHDNDDDDIQDSDSDGANVITSPRGAPAPSVKRTGGLDSFVKRVPGGGVGGGRSRGMMSTALDHFPPSETASSSKQNEVDLSGW